MFRYFLLIFSVVFYADYAKADEYTEYNKWYSKDGVLYDIAQTKDENPVMLSIYSPGKANANMVVSYYSQGECDNNITTLQVDSHQFPAKYTCIPEKHGQINHFTVSDADSVNYLVDRLKSGFTILLQNDIKVWVENFNNPKFGIAPNFW